MTARLKKQLWAFPLVLALLLGVGCFVIRGWGMWVEAGTCYDAYNVGIWDGQIYLSHDLTDGLHLPSELKVTVHYISLAPSDGYHGSSVTERCGVTYVSWTDPSRTFVDSSSLLLIPFPYVATILGIAALLLRHNMRQTRTHASRSKLWKAARNIPAHALPLVGILLIVILWLLVTDRQVEFAANALNETFSAAMSFQHRDVTYEISHYSPKPHLRRIPFTYIEILELSVTYRDYAPAAANKTLGFHFESHLDKTSQNLSAEFVAWYPIAGLVVVFWWMRHRRVKTQPTGFPVGVSAVAPANYPALPV